MIEDFAKPTDTEALSSIPLQFLVYVFNSDETCDERPDFTEETRPKGSCIGISPGGTYFDRIIVRAGAPSKRWRKDVVIVVVLCCVCVVIQSTLALWTFYWIKNSHYTDFERGEIRFFRFFYHLLSRLSYRLMLFLLRISKFKIFFRSLRSGNSRIKQ